MCQRNEDEAKGISRRLSDHNHLALQQLGETRRLQTTLHNLQENPREDPKQVARIHVLQEQKEHLETALREKDNQIARLEDSYKERTNHFLKTAERFATDIQKLNDAFNRREEEYRRSLDQASELTNIEAKRALDEAKQETHKEFQQERTKRQALERELRQAKQDLSVIEQKYQRALHSEDALQNELAATKLGHQAIAEHLEEKARGLQHQLDRDGVVTTQLKAALANKEMDLTGLQSSMEAYDEKVRTIIEHLRGWAQDYTHIGAIRSRLEMLGQTDQSCAATARIREAEHVDSVLSQLRQYYARHSGPERQEQVPAELYLHSDDSHEHRISELSALLNAEVASAKTAGLQGETLFSGPPEREISTPLMPFGKGTGALETPENGAELNASSARPPAVQNEKKVNMLLEANSCHGSPTSAAASSPVLQRRATRAAKAAAGNSRQRNPMSPTGLKMSRRAKRKPATSKEAEPGLKRRYTEKSKYFEHGEVERGLPAGSASADDPGCGNTTAAYQTAVKIESS